MDHNMSIEPIGTNWTTEWIANQDLSLLRKCIVWLEMSTALTALAINGIVMSSVMGNNASCRGYFYGLLNLSLAQCLLSSTSLAGVVSSLCVLDYSFPPSTSKDNWWRTLLHNIMLAIFSGLCVTGAAALSWTHWWSLNIANANHPEMPTGYRVVKAIFWVLWLTTLLFCTWLNFLVVMWGSGLTTTMAENDGRVIQPCLHIYSLTLFVSACILVFSNLTSVPPVTGHLTTRAMRSSNNYHQHDCRDADCVCSDSEVDDDLSARGSQKNGLKPALKSNDETYMNHSKVNTIPTTIITLDEDTERVTRHPSAGGGELISSNKAINNLHPNRRVCESILSGLSGTDAPACNISIYSADISANSTSETLAESALKLSAERLQQRLQQLNDARPVPPPDPESPQSSFAASRTGSKVGRKRTKKKRKPFKKLKGVTRLQFERPTRVQVSIMVSFVLLYLPPWFLLVAGIFMPQHATYFLSIFRLLINVVSSVNPVLQGLRHPRFALKMARTWRRIYPSSISFSQQTSAGPKK